MAEKVKIGAEKDLYGQKKRVLRKLKEIESHSGRKVDFIKAGDAIASNMGIAIPEVNPMEKIEEVNLKISQGKKYLVATNIEMGIFTEGENWDILMKNIKEVIEAYFDIPSADVVKINLQIDPMVAADA